MHSPANVRYAKVDPATAVASLFRPVCRGRRPKGLKVVSKFDGFNVMFTCYEWLDTVDQSVLLATVALAGMAPATLTKHLQGPIGKKLWKELHPEQAAEGGSSLVVTTTRYALLKAAGMSTSKRDYQRLDEILYRLSQVGCFVRKAGYSWSMNLLSFACEPDGTVHIALNERFARAIFGHYVMVSLEERRRLKSDAAKILHAWLSAITRPGSESLAMGLDALAVRIWGTGTKNKNTKHFRRKAVVKAIAEIEALGWKTERQGRGERHQVRLKRPKAPDRFPRLSC